MNRDCPETFYFDLLEPETNLTRCPHLPVSCSQFDKLAKKHAVFKIETIGVRDWVFLSRVCPWIASYHSFFISSYLTIYSGLLRWYDVYSLLNVEVSQVQLF